MKLLGLRRLLAIAGLAGVAFLAPRALHAQTGKISGVVVDAATNQPVEGVAVVVQGTGLGAMTQANGRYFLLSVPPGVYTVMARRIGYGPQEISNVRVSIDVTRELNFSLTSSGTTLATQRIVAEAAPLVEQGITGSQQSIQADVIEALPVTSVAGVLSLQQGFLEQPQNTDIVSFTDTRRNVLSPIRIRGGRGGETLTLIDGIPVNNVVFGGAALDLNSFAVSELNYQKGGFEPQYGNALSGIINMATREGGTQLAGNVEYQGTGLGGKLGSTSDELWGLELFRGYLSGPIPGTSNKVRFMLSGQTANSADRVMEFDDIIYRARVSARGGSPLVQDLFPGWRAFGYDTQHDVFGKLTFKPMADATINLSVLDYERQRMPFDFDFLLTGFDVLNTPGVRNLDDSLAVFPSRAQNNGAYTVQGSIRAIRRLYSSSWQQRFGRSNITLRLAQFNQERQTCNFFNGICLGANFADVNFSESFVFPNTAPVIGGNSPSGTDQFFGGEKVRSNIFRLDGESQVTDHHNVQAGVFYQRHDMKFGEVRNQGTNAVLAVPLRYETKPWDAAAYLQDKIEYDFLTVKLGFRFDYGKAVGQFFRNPLDPTNGTTATDVCNGAAPSLGATTVFTGVDTSNGAPLSGLQACANPKESRGFVGARTFLMDSATKIAARDDFAEADPRKAFSPRIGVSFPLTERAALFFNAGRYSQNPLYNNLYQNTNVGLSVGNGCTAKFAVIETTRCQPTIFSDAYTTAYLGNTNLALEQTTSYEVGYAGEMQQNYAIRVTLFSKDQTGLTGIRNSDPTLTDVGATYGTGTPRYSVIVNQDYATVRGVEMQVQRRVANYWGFDINYSFSKATTNSAPPDVAQQRNSQGDPTSNREITSEIDQPHVINASLLFRVTDRAPAIRWGDLLRNTYLTITNRAASGLPYTPTRCFSGIGGQCQFDVNAGRGPATMQTDLLAGKDFRISNVRYGAFARVVNVFDRKNCVQVFTTTGRCDAGAPDQDRNQNGNPVGSTASNTFFDRAMFYGQRRVINTGLRVTF